MSIPGEAKQHALRLFRPLGPNPSANPHFVVWAGRGRRPNQATKAPTPARTITQGNTVRYEPVRSRMTPEIVLPKRAPAP